MSPIKLFFWFYKTGFKEEDIDTPFIDVSDIFDVDDDDQNKKPRAREDHRTREVADRLLDSMQCENDKLDHDNVDLNQKPRDDDDHRKRKVDEQLLDSVQCENAKDQNKKQRADTEDKG